MREIVVLAAILLAGCVEEEGRSGLGDACVGLGIAPLVEGGPSPAPGPTKCCGKCGGTGRVKSGDGLAWVPCECPDTCECKGAVLHPPVTIKETAKAASPPKSGTKCEGGSCREITGPMRSVLEVRP